MFLSSSPFRASTSVQSFQKSTAFRARNMRRMLPMQGVDGSACKTVVESSEQAASCRPKPVPCCISGLGTEIAVGRSCFFSSRCRVVTDSRFTRHKKLTLAELSSLKTITSSGVLSIPSLRSTPPAPFAASVAEGCQRPHHNQTEMLGKQAKSIWEVLATQVPVFLSSFFF